MTTSPFCKTPTSSGMTVEMVSDRCRLVTILEFPDPGLPWPEDDEEQ